MMSQKLPPFWTYFWISIVLGLLGWGGLVFLIFLTLPTLGPRWMFFFLLFLGLSGTAIPVMYFINRRFPVEPPVEGGVVMREAMWVGVYGSVLVWLQMGRVLTSGLAVVLAVGLVLIEFLLRVGERSNWAPTEPEPGSEEAEEEEDPFAVEGEEDD